MSYFPGLKLTKQGEQLLAKVNGNLNETITFKRAELGSGTIVSDDEIRFLTKLKEKWKDVSISDCKIIGEEQTQVQIELQFDNGDMEIEKIFREIGIYAAAKDGTEIYLHIVMLKKIMIIFLLQLIIHNLLLLIF